jgi:SAM-dependent methyltransferase
MGADDPSTWLRFVESGNEDEFGRCKSYIQDLIRDKTLRVLNIDRVNRRLYEDPVNHRLVEDLLWCLEELFEPNLAACWNDFVDVKRRLSNEEARVLDEVVQLASEENDGKKNGTRVFDAAMGVGAETIHLLNRGFDVVSNEIDWGLIKHAEANAREQGVEEKLRVLRLDWRHLANEVEESSFDVVICLGNSLTCLSTIDDMRRTLDAFRFILRRHGLLVIDERNYRDMFRRKRQMLSPGFRFEGRVVYCGDIKAKPVEIPDRPGDQNHPVVLGYYKDRERVGTFSVYPYGEGAFEELLGKSGFEVVETLWDFQRAERHDAEFITYVARARGDRTNGRR